MHIKRKGGPLAVFFDHLRLEVRVFVIFLFCSFALGQQSENRARIRGPIDENRRIVLHGNRPPLAAPEFDQGAAPDNLPAKRMMILLSRSSDQQAALEKFLEEQQTPASPNYHQWLSPAEFGRRFGVDDADIQSVTNWLQQQGFTVDDVLPSKNVIEFSGSARLVRQAFHTSIHKYLVNGREHWANAQDPEIPAALAPVITGVVSLNNFPRKPLSRNFGTFSRDRNNNVTADYTVSNGSGTYYALAPADFATIYNTNPLLQAGNNGAGQKIAILGRSNVNLQDVTDFRSLFGLGPGNTSVVLDGPDPGIVESDEVESLLDLEWANAVAPGASVVLVSAQDTETTSGIDLAALYVIEHDLAGVMSVSYGACEAQLGTAGNQFIKALWQQAAAQGITVAVSSGDSGSAGCDDQNVVHVAEKSLGINGLASTAYNVAIGGTDFDDAGTQTTYWNSSNDATTRASAKSYIPETTWNQSCAASATATNLGVCPSLPSSGTPPASLNLWAGSGGASGCTVSTSSGGSVICQSGSPKPDWQSGPGVPADSARDIPDISLFAAVGSNSKSFYVVCQKDALPAGYSSCQPSSGSIFFVGVGGTSAAAPSFAGIVALASQKAGKRLGNINYLLYNLAAQAGSSCSSSASAASSCIFNDIVKGNIAVPCQAGTANCSLTTGTGTGVMIDSAMRPAYTAVSGYDLATGLGSLNVANLTTGIANGLHNSTPTSLALTLNGSTNPLTVQHSEGIDIGVSVSPSASSGSVSLIGNAGGIDSNLLTTGVANWTSKLFPGGAYTVRAHYAGDGSHGASDSNPISVTVNPESSQTFVNLVTFSANGMLQSYTANTVPYGSNYLLRVDVADAAGTISSAQGVSSKCSAGNATCPTGKISLTANGNSPYGGSFSLNGKGFTEDQTIQLGGGTYNVSAAYPGDASYNASIGNSVITITKAPTSLTAGTTPGPYQYGTIKQVDAQMTTSSNGAAPTGTITFLDNGADAGTSIQQPFVSTHPGSAQTAAGLTFTAFYVPPSLGAHTLTAQYAGDPNYAGSTAASVSLTVTQASVYTGSYGFTPSTATPNLPVKLSVQFRSSSQVGTPTGTVTFYDNGSTVPAAVTYTSSTGTIAATLTANFAQTGQNVLSATYSGDTYYLSGTQQLGTLTVYNQIPTTLQTQSSFNPALVNYPTTLTATLGIPNSNNLPTPTGTIAFSDNGQQISGNVTYTPSWTGYGSYSLQASLPYTFTTSGTHNITASYSGDSTYAVVTGPALSLSVVDKLPTSIPYVNVYNVAANQPTSISASINANGLINMGPTMTGTVTFLDGGTPLAGTVSITNQPGYLSATLPYTFPDPGTHNITVQYSGDDHYAASQSKVFPINILGPVSVQFPNSTLTMSESGGTSSVYPNVNNNTSSALTVTFTCKSDSAGATCALNPSTANIPAHAGISGPQLTFTVPALRASVHQGNPFTIPFVFAGVLAGVFAGSRRRRALGVAVLLVALIIGMASCGGGGGGSSSVSNPSTGGGGPLASATYHFTLTATSGNYTDSQTLTVIVQ